MNLTSFEHAFKTFAHDLVVGAKKTEQIAEAILTSPKVAEGEAAAAAVLEQISPAAGKVTDLGESLIAKAASAVIAAGSAAAAGGVSITLDQTAVADVQAVVAAAKSSVPVTTAAATAAPAA